MLLRLDFPAGGAPRCKTAAALLTMLRAAGWPAPIPGCGGKADLLQGNQDDKRDMDRRS
jgi:hypothetical protein